MTATTILDNICVVDMTSVLLGPYCTRTLADLGADIVKVEPKSGDIIRLVGQHRHSREQGPTHLNLNRGKRCVNWDMKTDLGKEAMRRLLKKSDIFIHNIRPNAIDRLGLSFEQVKAIKPDIIYVHCLGFSPEGPYAGQPAYDDIIQALAGYTDLSSIVDGSGEKKFIPTAIADKVTGLHAVYATLAAIIQRDKTKESVHVEVPMMECATSFILTEHFDSATLEPPTGEFGYERQLDPTRQPYRTKDGWVVVAPYSDDRWLKIFEVFGAPELLVDDRFSDFHARRANRSLLQEMIAPFIEKYSTNEILALMNEADIPAANANTLEDLKTDPHLVEIDFFQKREHPTEGFYWETQPPVNFKGIKTKQTAHASSIGQDNEIILEELGLSNYNK